MIPRTRRRRLLILVCISMLCYIYFEVKNATWKHHYSEVSSIKPHNKTMSNYTLVSRNVRNKSNFGNNDQNLFSFDLPSPYFGWNGNGSGSSSLGVGIDFKNSPSLGLVRDAYDNAKDEHEDYSTDEIPGDEELHSFIADYKDDSGNYPGIPAIKPTNGTVQFFYGIPEHDISYKNKSEDIEWYKTFQDRFAERLERVKNVCKKYKNLGYSQVYTKRHLLYYSQRYDLLVCLSAKVGSSTWKSHLLHMKGINPVTNNIHQNHWENKIKARNILGGSLEKHLRTSTKVVTVRHPLERLVSAFRDKYCDGQLVNKPQSRGHFRYFWRPAYRSLRKKKRPDGKLQITFHEFLRYVIQDQKTSGVGDRHWSRLFRSCSICSFHYKYIMKLETYTEDLAYLTYLFNISEFSVHDRRHSLGGLASSLYKIKETSARQSTLQYYNDVPASVLAKIFHVYKIDFEMFHYEIPEILQRKVEGLSK